MKKFYLAGLLIALYLSFTIISCRPPWLEGAIVHLKAGRDEQAYNLLLEGTQKEPNVAEGWYYLGSVQGKKGMVAEMMESFSKSLSIDKTFQNEIDLEKNTYFGNFFNAGVAAYNAFIKIEDRESESALKSLNAVIDNFNKAKQIKNDFTATRLIAIAYGNLNDPVNELKYLQEASKIKPDTLVTWLGLGYYHMQEKDYTKAAENFKKGLDIDPNSVECWTLYAQNLDFGDKREEAIAAYKVAIEKNPEEKAIPFNLGLLLNKMANAVENDDAQKNAHYDEAIIYFAKAHELDPDLKDAYDLLSALLLQRGRYPEAEALLKEGLQRFPESSSIWQNWAFLLARQGKKVEAEKAMERSKQLQEQ
jgi:tetratricopeptide (TPR) repeat protein